MLPRQFANWVLRRTQSKWLSSTRSSGSRSMAISSTKVLPILVVAALGRELHALSDHPQPELELLETGEGIANAERNVEDWLEHRLRRRPLDRASRWGPGGCRNRSRLANHSRPQFTGSGYTGSTRRCGAFRYGGDGRTNSLAVIGEARARRLAGRGSTCLRRHGVYGYRGSMRSPWRSVLNRALDQRSFR